MANTYYSSTGPTTIADLIAALTSKYGEGVTIHYQTAPYLVFSCPAISSKVIKVYKNTSNSYVSQWYYGDSWSGGYAITNQVQFNGSNDGTVSAVHLILGSNYLLMVELSSGNPYSSTTLIGKLTNDDYIVVGLSGSTYITNRLTRNLTTGLEIYPLTLDRPAYNASNYLYKQTLMFVTSGGLLLVNGDGTPATISGLYNVGLTNSSGSITLSSNYFITPSNVLNYGSVTMLRTGIMAEF